MRTKIDFVDIWSVACIVAITFGVWSVVNRPHDDGTRDSEWALIALGAGGLIVVRRVPLRLASRKRIERKASEFRRALFSGYQPEYRIAASEAFPQLDQFFYQEMADRFERNGFRFLGDVEDAALARASGLRTFTRCLVGPDGRITVGIRHMIYPPLHIDQREIHLQSEFNDGTYLITWNTGERTFAKLWSGITALYCSPKTPLDEMVQLHLNAFLGKLLSKSNLSATRVASLDDLIHVQERIHRVISRDEQARDFKDPPPTKAAAQHLLETLRLPLRQAARVSCRFAIRVSEHGFSVLRRLSRPTGKAGIFLSRRYREHDRNSRSSVQTNLSSRDDQR